MWEFYLAASEASFATGGLAVAQVQLALNHQTVPLTRDYLYPQEAARPLRRAG
jgi:cyclopropane-fatty-acyl-phospholipid synthase